MDSDTRWKWWMGYLAGIIITPLFYSDLSWLAAILIGIPICWVFMYLAERF